MKRCLLVVVLCLAMSGLIAQSHAATYKKQVLNAATASPLNGPYGRMVEKFKTTLEELSGGAIQVKNLSGGALGDEQANVKQLRSQELHMSILFVGNLSPFSATATMFNMPYMFPKIEDAYTLFRNKEFMKKTGDIIARQAGVRPLGWVVGGYRHITNSKHPIKKIGDLQGLKIRVSPAPVQMESFRAWGVDPHPLAWTETFNALQQGVVDGQENPYVTNADQKFWEVQKYTTELHYIIWMGPVLVSEAWYQKQDPETKAIIEKAAQAVQEFGSELYLQMTEKAKQDCIDHGMIIDTLEDEPVWMEKARAIWPKFYKSIGGDAPNPEATGKELMDAAVAIIAAGQKK